MTEIVAESWEGLYKTYMKMYRKCHKAGHRPIIMTTYGGEYITGPEGKSMAVILRCGWTWEKEPAEIDRLTGTVVGLTKKQVELLHRLRTDYTVLKAVGPEWPGYREAKRRALNAGATYD